MNTRAFAIVVCICENFREKDFEELSLYFDIYIYLYI